MVAQIANQEFQFGSQQESGRLGLLVASISKSADSIPIKVPSLNIPAFRVNLPLPHSPATSSRQASRKSTPRHPPKLENAGAEIQRVAALVGSILIAGLSKAVHHVSKSDAAAAHTLPFHQSFTFPWNHRHAIKQRYTNICLSTPTSSPHLVLVLWHTIFTYTSSSIIINNNNNCSLYADTENQKNLQKISSREAKTTKKLSMSEQQCNASKRPPNSVPPALLLSVSLPSNGAISRFITTFAPTRSANWSTSRPWNMQRGPSSSIPITQAAT